MKVNVTAQAQTDLDEIVAWIGADNPARAVTFAEELWTRCQSLGSRPERFPLVCSMRGRRVRKLSHKGYLMLYFLMEDHVEVARIVHSTRDWAAMLREVEQDETD